MPHPHVQRSPGRARGACRRARIAAAVLTALLLSTAGVRALEIDVTAPPYNAVPDDGLDDAPAFQRALEQAATAERAAIRIPAGAYHLSTPATIAVGEVNISILGEGIGVSTLYATSTGGVFRITNGSRRSQYTLRDFTLFADLPGAGTAIEITAPPGGARQNRAVLAESVEIRGVDPSEDYFDIGLSVDGCWRPLLQHVTVSGPFGPGVSTNVSDSSPRFAAMAGIVIDNCYAPSLQDCQVFSAKIGVSFDSRDENGAPEDGSLLGCTIQGCRTGLYVYDRGNEPQLVADSCDFHCRDAGIQLVGRKFFQINNCTFNNLTTDDTWPYVDILLDGVFGGIISDNVFGSPVNPARTMIRLQNTSRDLLIMDNIFAAPESRALDTTAGSSGIRITDNLFE
ncbi:right-handed parallel beta-helix repeat-containing protein [Kiritimatiella glycovorans]|uniref:Right handed beta helix domain-containing protein n=1 Tax=Kiritimatiella glycovorans TaxID=1307763 RepID=A0A0G3EAU1_9BACT|nr:right-handed parallel beta-helix repeat-containing protein [Kiritimatiella glycovorans]AKJ63606.1 hypothetical protein L21SP4_00325 [Kiritimatiella glycovorans]